LLCIYPWSVQGVFCRRPSTLTLHCEQRDYFDMNAAVVAGQWHYRVWSFPCTHSWSWVQATSICDALYTTRRLWQGLLGGLGSRHV